MLFSVAKTVALNLDLWDEIIYLFKMKIFSPPPFEQSVKVSSVKKEIFFALQTSRELC